MVLLARAGDVWQSARLDVAWAVGFAQQVGLERQVRPCHRVPLRRRWRTGADRSTGSAGGGRGGSVCASAEIAPPL